MQEDSSEGIIDISNNKGQNENNNEFSSNLVPEAQGNERSLRSMLFDTDATSQENSGKLSSENTQTQFK